MSKWLFSKYWANIEQILSKYWVNTVTQYFTRILPIFAKNKIANIEQILSKYWANIEQMNLYDFHSSICLLFAQHLLSVYLANQLLNICLEFANYLLNYLLNICSIFAQYLLFPIMLRLCLIYSIFAHYLLNIYSIIAI